MCLLSEHAAPPKEAHGLANHKNQQYQESVIVDMGNFKRCDFLDRCDLVIAVAVKQRVRAAMAPFEGHIEVAFALGGGIKLWPDGYLGL